MKLKLLLLVFVNLLLSLEAFSQKKLLWSSDIEITTASFQGVTPEMAKDNLQQYFFYCTWEFNFQMPNMQFALTKNFNNYVEAYYIPSLSWMEEGEMTDQLLLLANLDFDIAELFARKFRKSIYEQKKLGSSLQIFNQIHTNIQAEYVNYRAKLDSEVRAADNVKELFLKYEKEINSQINELNEFCKKCKPKKKKKRNKKK